MTDEPAIEAVDLGKRYRRRHKGERTLKSLLIEKLVSCAPVEEFWALRHVEFQVRRGATFGNIGRNGSGKSTQLGILARTVTPTEGEIRVRGSVATLLELGAGFHPDLTGRENIYLNAAILGLSRRQTEARFDRIVEFAGLSEFIDTPVKHYSSGMYVRLGFAVAVEVDPDILLVDEVLAVGDESFQRKCLAKIEEFQARGKTILIVSHALPTIERLCTEVILLDDGSKLRAGAAGEVVAEYLRRTLGRDRLLWVEEYGTRRVEIGGVCMYGADGRPSWDMEGARPARLEIDYVAHEPLDSVVFGFMVKRENDQIVFGTNTQIAGLSLPLPRGPGRVAVEIDPLPLLTGKYYLSVAVHSPDHQIQYHRQESWYAFNVRNGTRHHGEVLFPCRWVLEAGAAAKVTHDS